MPLKIISKEKIFEGKFIKVWATKFLDKVGREQVWEWTEKKDFVLVFPITWDRKIVLIKNFRVPIERYVIEMVAGRLDNDDETLEETASRELLEETGYEAEKMYRLRDAAALPGTVNNYAKIFIATGCKKKIESTGDETEDLTVFEIEGKKLLDYYFDLPADTLFNNNIIALFTIAETKGFIR